MQKHKQVAKDSARKWIVRISCCVFWNDEDRRQRAWEAEDYSLWLGDQSWYTDLHDGQKTDRVDGKTIRLKAIVYRTRDGLAWQTAGMMHEEAEKLEDMAGERRDEAQIADTKARREVLIWLL
jgi:hypothetical protein